MKILATLAVSALVIAPTAAAGSPRRTRVLEHRLHNMAVIRHQLQARVEQLAAANASLQSQLSQADGALAATQQQNANLQAQLAAIPTPLAVAVEDVRKEVVWAGGPLGPSNGDLVAKAAMDYTIGHVRTGVYGYFEALYNEPPGGPDLMPYYAPVNEILGAQDGICLHAERVFATIVHAFGFDVRDVGFNYTDWTGVPGAHSAAEVFYDGGWHFFDPTFGVFYQDASGTVMSIAAARAGTPTAMKDAAAFVNLVEGPPQPGADTTWFELLPSTVVSYVAEPY